MHQKDQPPEEEKFSSFDRLMSLGQSDETDFEVSKTFDQQTKMKQRDRLCYTLAQMECWFKIAQSDTLAFQKIIKQTKAIQRNWTHQTPARIRLKKDHWRRKGALYLKAISWQSALSKTKIATLSGHSSMTSKWAK